MQNQTNTVQKAINENVQFIIDAVSHCVALPMTDQIKKTDQSRLLMWQVHHHSLIINVSCHGFLASYFNSTCDDASHCQVWLAHWLPQPYDLAPLISVIHRYQAAMENCAKIKHGGQHVPIPAVMLDHVPRVGPTIPQPLSATMATVTPKPASNDPKYYSTEEKASILADFGFELDIVDPIFDETYGVPDGTKWWVKTGCADYDDALDAVINCLKERCYLPTSYDEIVEYTHVDWLTHEYLQQQINEHGATTAKAIERIYDVFNRLDPLLDTPLPPPSLIEINKNVMTYKIKWQDVEILIDLDGTLLYQKDGDWQSISLYSGLSQVAQALAENQSTVLNVASS